MKRAKAGRECPASYSLSEDQKLFYATARRGVILLQNAAETAWRPGSTRTHGGAYSALLGPLQDLCGRAQ